MTIWVVLSDVPIEFLIQRELGASGWSRRGLLQDIEAVQLAMTRLGQHLSPDEVGSIRKIEIASFRGSVIQ